MRSKPIFSSSSRRRQRKPPVVSLIGSRVTAHDDGSWGYEEDTVLMIRNQAEPFHHTDVNGLRKIGEPTPRRGANSAFLSELACAQR